MGCSIYLVSKLFTLFIAAIQSQERKDDKSILVFINQPAGENSVYKLLEEWKGNPFTEVYSFQGQFKGTASKAKQRKELFRQIRTLIEEQQPDQIFTGNDRRMEFQYAKHIASKTNREVTGHYLDEGTFTYLGRKPANPVGHYLDNIIKKAIYGSWWQEPETIGASDKISHVYAAFPDLIDERLKTKQVHQLDSSGFMSEEITELCQLLLLQKDVRMSDLKDIDGIITLPFESIYQNDKGYRDRVLKALKEIEGKIAVKYHPRDKVEDYLGLLSEGVILLPATVPFEAVLPVLRNGVKVFGDVSSTLLAARWLRPDLEVVSFRGKTINLQLEDLFVKIGIEIR